jgi:hypothetical protein
MKVILGVGSPHSGLEQVFEVLVTSGVSPAQPAGQGALSPQAMQQQLLRSQEVVLAGPAPLAQVVPGRLWCQLAADLFLANIHSTTWGWSDPQTTVLMDFWQDFDPQVRLLLVYNSPQAYLAQVLDHTTPPSEQTVAAALSEWMRWNTALLRYYHRHADGCVLVSSEQATAQPGALVAALASQWQVSGLDASAVSPGASAVFSHLQFHLINELIAPQHPALGLCQELDGAALLSPLPGTGPQADATPSAAWADWVSVRLELDQLAQAHKQQAEQIVPLQQALAAEQALASQCAQAHEGLTHAVGALQAERDQLAQAAAALQTEQQRLSQLLDQQAAQLAQATQKAASNPELTEENELLLLQLHQVQEELEHYFLRAQELEQGQQTQATGFVADFWRMHQPTELVINMQHDIAGSNWYPPESDGRWAGPANLSTVQMPPVQPGNYTLELDIVDAMNLGIVNNLVVEALGQTQPVEVFYPLYQGEYPLICKVPLSISQSAADQPWAISLRFAQTVCPADSGSDDRRNLTARLRSVKLVKQA